MLCISKSSNSKIFSNNLRKSFSNYSNNKEIFMSFKMDNKFNTNPLSDTTDLLSGFKKFQGWDLSTTEKYWRLGLNYIDHRYGLNSKSLKFNTQTGISYLNIDNNGLCNQTDTITEKTNAILMPMTFTGCNNYKLEHTNSDKFDSNNKPIAHLSEFFYDFFK